MLFGQAQRMLWEEGGALIPYFSDMVLVINRAVDMPDFGYGDTLWHLVTVNRG
jgi:hypothetical protein